jgi:hypothetical protein
MAMYNNKNGTPAKFAGKTCGECANHYDEHSPALDGHMTLARCSHYTGGKYCVLMSDQACKHYKD